MSSSIIQFQSKIISRWSSKSKVGKKDRKRTPVRLIVLVPNSKTHSTTSSVSKHTLEILLKLPSLPGLMPNASSPQYIYFLRIFGRHAVVVLLLLRSVRRRINVPTATAAAIWWDQRAG